jgi:protein O-GlcNAc transferase
MTYLAYCATTGLPAMDYRITDAIVDPRGSDALSSEQLICLDRLFCAYAPPIDIEVSPPPATASGHITFGAMCTLAKINDAVIDLWAQVLAATPYSKLLMQSRGLDTQWHERMRDAFGRHNIAPDRIELLNQAPLAEYLKNFSRIDIALDPFPFSAHTTTCHALWMGVPVITLTGETSVSRVSTSILRSTGLPDLTATTPRQYVEIATLLASDTARLKELRHELRPRLKSSPLMDGANLTRKIEHAYRAAWRKWCAKRI